MVERMLELTVIEQDADRLSLAHQLLGLRKRGMSYYACSREMMMKCFARTAEASVTASSGRMAAVLRAADAACYAAKEAGRGIYVEHATAPPDVLTPREPRRVSRLAQAVDEGRFHLYAQPIVPLVPEPRARPRCEILLRLPDERGSPQPAAGEDAEPGEERGLYGLKQEERHRGDHQFENHRQHRRIEKNFYVASIPFLKTSTASSTRRTSGSETSDGSSLIRSAL